MVKDILRDRIKYVVLRIEMRLKLPSIQAPQVAIIDRFSFAVYTSIILAALGCALLAPNPNDGTIFIYAARAVRLNLSPYDAGIFYYSPLWLAWSLLPISFLPDPIYVRLLAFSMALCGGLVVLRLSRDRFVISVALLCPYLWLSAIFGNIENAVLLAAVLPFPIGIWILVLKPQMSIGLLIHRSWQALRDRRAIHLIAISLCAVLLAVSINAGMLRHSPINQVWSTSPWPYGIPIGVIMLLIGLRRDDWRWSFAASMFFAPYIETMSYLCLLPLAMLRRWSALAFVALSWLLVLLTLPR